MGRSSKDRRDIFYRLAKEEGWRARSAFKLLHIDSYFKIFENVTRAVDLCAAPGSWSQVLAQQLRKNNQIVANAATATAASAAGYSSGGSHGIVIATAADALIPGNPIAPNELSDLNLNDVEEATPETYIVAVDLQTMSPIPGVTCLKGDITDERTANEVIRLLGDTKAQLVVCDGAPDVTGLHQLDEFLQGQLLYSALSIATIILEEGGTFVAKIFRASRDGIETVYCRLKMFFEDVQIAKPRSSRSTSIESFVVCRNFKLPENFTPGYLNPFAKDFGTLALEKRSPRERMIIKFVCCGDLNGFDSDTNYPFSGTSLAPVQLPIDPPYAEAVRRRKLGLLGLAEGEIEETLTKRATNRPRPKNKYLRRGNTNVESAGNPEAETSENPEVEIDPSSSSSTAASTENSTSAGATASNSDLNKPTLKIFLNFGGGAEKLVGDIRETIAEVSHEFRDSEASKLTMSSLLEWVKTNLIVERPELLIKDGNVRPGILVLINDMDWELLGNLEYELAENDRVSFISTLHGG